MRATASQEPKRMARKSSGLADQNKTRRLRQRSRVVSQGRRLRSVKGDPTMPDGA